MSNEYNETVGTEEHLITNEEANDLGVDISDIGNE